MPTLSKIVVATDFGPASERAVFLGGELARRTNAELALLHVYDPAPLGPAVSYPVPVWTGSDYERSMRDRATTQLRRCLDEQLDGVARVSLHALDHSSPVTAVCDFAEAAEADLIVTGTHGREGLEALLMGSVAERIARHAPCSVVAARAKRHPDVETGHVLVCTDFSEGSEAMLRQSGELRALFGNRLTLLHVYESAPDPLLRDHPERRRLGETGTTAALLRRALDDLNDRFFAGKADAALIESDHPAEAIVAYAQAREADVIVIGTHGRTGLSRLLIGSVAERVTRTADCSVWVSRNLSADVEAEPG